MQSPDPSLCTEGRTWHLTIMAIVLWWHSKGKIVNSRMNGSMNEVTMSVFSSQLYRLLHTSWLMGNAPPLYGRLSFHPIPCGTALSGHVTSGTTLHGQRSSPRVSQLWQVTGSLSLLPTNQSHGGTTLGSCCMELARWLQLSDVALQSRGARARL